MNGRELRRSELLFWCVKECGSRSVLNVGAVPAPTLSSYSMRSTIAPLKSHQVEGGAISGQARAKEAQQLDIALGLGWSVNRTRRLDRQKKRMRL
jgi:hypothetical protein